MKQRLISAAVGLSIGVVILFFYDTIVLNFALAVIVLLALNEVFAATHYRDNRGLSVICFAFCLMVPFFHISQLKIAVQIFCFAFILALFILLLYRHKTMKLEQIGTAFLLTLLISFSFSTIVFIRDIYLAPSVKLIGLFYILLVFIGAWMTDAGAYFIGRFFGRNKLAPNISPKKTVEGALGGIAVTVLAFFALSLIFQWVFSGLHCILLVNYVGLAVMSVLSAFFAILGDLSASMIKREYRIKDFGNIMPGHGGVLDRFDSIMFVAPFILMFIQLFPVVQIRII
ncbi:MAG TPA: phosphatidate cytidylyltransferase [Clostridia bacterium]|nr:phosphatidate cytidylyltransferase [Clostridia bacterium]